MNKTIPIRALIVPLMAIVIVAALFLHFYRRLSGSMIDDRGEIPVAREMIRAMLVSAASVFALCVEGYVKRGNTQMSKNQIQTFLLVLVAGYLFALVLRGHRDYRTLGRLVVAAACSKAMMAIWVWYVIDQPLGFRTRHGDSLLFCVATLVLLVQYFEQPIRRHLHAMLWILPLILGGMFANNRRLAWVELAVSLGLLVVVSRRTPLKMKVARAVLCLIPVAALYVAAGWNSTSPIFGPVKTLRSISDADTDRSTLYRDIEDYNLLATLKLSPIVGSGFGQPYGEFVPHDDISGFKEYLYLPHNSILRLWVVGGLIGFTGIVTALMAGLFFAARGYAQAMSPVDRAAAFTALATIAIYLIQCWGDIGFSETTSIFLLAPALAIAAQVGAAAGGRQRAGVAAGSRAA